jgi:hypothetical protein
LLGRGSAFGAAAARRFAAAMTGACELRRRTERRRLHLAPNGREAMDAAVLASWTTAAHLKVDFFSVYYRDNSVYAALVYNESLIKENLVAGELQIS